MREAFDCTHGVFLGATMSSEKTAAAGTVGELHFDPFAMLPFCGCNMADYFAHWLTIGRHEGAQLPKVFYVNWFRKDSNGDFLWPGYGENSRVLAWIFRRCQDRANAHPTPIGLVPDRGDLDTSGLDFSPEALEALLDVNTAELRTELPQISDHLAQFGDRLPAELYHQLAQLEQRLADE